ncbi:tyrosine-type recombinase/integrase [Salinimonas chungwhensis]|uniref:tyrosine-type recombinase/integrase n=1 Tax=Salinimonas chungwhensis TaxID=265425 RepID=UPI0003739ACF|nr:tyrosine-type recombinase/integrase [Salinimonas chungwhensis]
MGRPRKEVNKSLPVGMYYNEKGKTFYLRSANSGDINLGKVKATAIQKYYHAIDRECEGFIVADLIERYMEEISPTLSVSTHKTSIPRARKLLVAFGDFPLEDLKTKDIQKYLDYRRKTPVDANRTVALLSSMYTAAERWGYIDRVPFKKIKFHKEEPRKRIVKMSEIDIFKEFCPSWMCLFIDLKFSTGLRQKDIRELTTENWNPSVGLMVQASKSQHRTCFDKCIELVSLIEEIERAAATRWKKGTATPKPLFPNKKGGAYTPSGFQSMWQKRMQKALKSGKLKERFREHDIRAMAATNRPDLEDARRLMGHKEASTTLRNYRRGYEHVMPNRSVVSTLL